MLDERDAASPDLRHEFGEHALQIRPQGVGELHAGHDIDQTMGWEP